MWNAWMQKTQKTLGSGGSANYRKAMSCPESRAELVQLAIALEAARKWGRRRPRDDLRAERLRCKRHRLEWNYKEARSRLRQRESNPYHIGLRNAMKAWQRLNRSRQDTRSKYTEHLAAAPPSPFTPAFLLPLRGDVISLPAQHADMMT